MHLSYKICNPYTEEMFFWPHESNKLEFVSFIIIFVKKTGKICGHLLRGPSSALLHGKNKLVKRDAARVIQVLLSKYLLRGSQCIEDVYIIKLITCGYQTSFVDVHYRVQVARTQLEAILKMCSLNMNFQ